MRFESRDAVGKGVNILRRRIGVVGEPFLLIPFAAGASSIASLLGYFYGAFSMRLGVLSVLVPGLALGFLFVAIARRRNRLDLAERVLAGVFAGGFATLGYDACRIPLVYAGLPIFKAISYFGTLILGTSIVSPTAEFVGWAYHYSNGVGFAVMYAVLAVRYRLWTAIAWGVCLEGAMLLTPYAEVFGYTRGRQFVAITVGAHVVYGVGLWAGFRCWDRWGHRKQAWRRAAAGFALPALGVALIGTDFHRLHSAKLPPAPPPTLGVHLYTTWNVLEVDRVVTLWLVRRFHDTEAEFALLPPFTKTPYGTPLDVPEAEIRRSGSNSAAEVALEKYGLRHDLLLVHLAEIATHFEITPWMSPPVGAVELGAALREGSDACEPCTDRRSLEPLFAKLDEWYQQEKSKAR